MGIVTAHQAGLQQTGQPLVLPWSRALTVADMENLPDDGHRYELIDGVLIVTPAPIVRHQIAVSGFEAVLRQLSPPSLRVLHAPLDVVLADDTVVEPDILVARRSDFVEKNLPTAPLLAVEVLSPSTRMIDLSVKRDRYRRAGVESYWVFDPAQARLVAWELRDGEYEQVADVTGDESWTARKPYEVTVVPARLLD
ncbi:Endonuclease, Uma2 family (restriction endonuclease fold) [Microlunatus soli]|uniref:Endonuclease, Uma2 family (Restriction endonuclease fold) n=1 Tax=Microlunatus soli TaxID=630515 RepID=A0A1H1QGT4_9ACTN|nr:Endonuclease, Uma2 family (restriction endonuclease fold) [Microlunatus soli]